MNEYNFTMHLRWAVDSAIEDAAEIGDQLADRIIQTETGVRIITRLTRNASQSSNGGDYTYWTDFSSVDEGVLESEDWSADFNAADWLSEPYLHQVDYTPEEIWLLAERIASHLTRARQRRTDRRASMIAPDSTPLAAEERADAAEWAVGELRAALEGLLEEPEIERRYCPRCGKSLDQHPVRHAAGCPVQRAEDALRDTADVGKRAGRYRALYEAARAMIERGPHYSHYNTSIERLDALRDALAALEGDSHE